MKAVIIQPGSILQNRYRVWRKLGEGGFGQTFEVEDKGTIKVLKVLNLNKFHSLEKKEQALLFFKREFNILSQIDRPFIPKVELDGYFTVNDESSTFHCLLMEKIEGNNLEEWLQQNGNQTITAELAIDWLKQLVKIVEYLHQKHCFHRDIKPPNIIIKPNGELVLIDFGAVREISNTYLTKIVEGREITAFVSPGYTPKEQMEGKALPQSDFYAIGRTLVHLLTGIHPVEMDEDNSTGELIWRDKAPNIGEQLADLIDCLMAPFPGERPQDTKQIWQRLAEIELIVGAGLSGHNSDISFGRFNNRNLLVWKGKENLKLLITSVAIAFFVVALRQLGIFQGLEWKAFDQMLRLRPKEEPDSRILVVQVTEEDIKKYRYPIPDAVLAKLFDKLMQYQARLIGLNIYRDRPVPEGTNSAILAPYWQHNKRLIAACYIDSHKLPDKHGIAPPKGLPESHTGFNDIVEDADGVIRRHLIFQSLDSKSVCGTQYSISFRLAEEYLAADGIKPENTSKGYLQLGKVVFKPLKANLGGYQGHKLGGYQVLLNYRSKHPETVTLRQVLENQIKPNLVKNRIVLIGMNTSTSSKLTTPYSVEHRLDRQVTTVMLQAQMVSQMLSGALDGRPLLRIWPIWGEILWIWGCSVVGGVVAWCCRSLGQLGFAGGAIAIALYGFCFILLLRGIWVPLIPSAFALIATGGSVKALRDRHQ